MRAAGVAQRGSTGPPTGCRGPSAAPWLASGNILCALDPASGTVRRAVRGHGSALEEIEAHPDSGARIPGFVLPCWREVVSLTLDAAGSFAPLRFQGWDVAVCLDGPHLVELNAGSDFGLPQIATGQGLADDTFAAFLAE